MALAPHNQPAVSLVDAAKALVRQATLCGFTDRAGHALGSNLAFIQLGEALAALSAAPAPVEIVRVLRVIEYVGPRDVVERQVVNSLHGQKSPQRGLTIKAATLGEFPEVLSNMAEMPFGLYEPEGV